RYEILPTDYMNWVDTVFLFPQDPTFQDAWDGYAVGVRGRPVSNNYVVLYRGGHKYEFWATDDIKPVAWWAQGNVAWVQIGRPGLEGRIALIESNELGRSNDGLNQKIVPLYKDTSRPPVELEPLWSTPGDPAQRIPLDPTATTRKRFDDHDVMGGGYGYPFNSQDPTQYPKVDPVLSAFPYFGHHDPTPTDPVAPDPMAQMSDTWPGWLLPGVGTSQIGPHAPNSLPYPFNPLSDQQEPWEQELPLDPSGNVVSGWIGPGFDVYSGPGSSISGPSPTRFCNDGTLVPNYVNITPDTSPTPYVGGKWTSATTFTFRIVYWQSDNLAPRLIQLRVRRNDGGANPGPWQSYTMQKVYPADNDYRDGCVFYYRLSAAQLPGGGGPGDYNYYFIASDGVYTAIFPNRPDRYIQPGGGGWDDPGDIGVVPDQAGNGPDYYWFRVNHPPVLSNQQVTPTVGRQGDNFVFRVDYADVDQQVPRDFYLRGVTPARGRGDRVYRALIHLDLFGNELGNCRVIRVLSADSDPARFTYETATRDASGAVVYYPDNALVGKYVELGGGQNYEITGNQGNVITLRDLTRNTALRAGISFRIADWFVGEMAQQDPTDDDYTNGATFVFDTATRVVLEPGVHRYFFTFTDDWGSWLFRDNPNVKVEGETVRLPGSGWFEGPEVIRNTAPRLADFRFVPKAATPGDFDGTTATEFTFYVTYYDDQNDPPSLIRVGIDGTADAPAQVLDMVPKNPNDRVYTDGAVYQSPPIRLSQGQHIFRAQCSDGSLTYPPLDANGKLNFAGPPDQNGQPTDYAQGPNVGPNTPPTLAYPPDDDGSDPRNPPGLEPNLGTPQTQFTYTVIYRDTDRYAGVNGNPPMYVQVYIDNVAYDMQPVDPNDRDYTDGAIYQARVSGLVAGKAHTYFFVASDGVDRARLPALGDKPNFNTGPTVDEPPGEPQQLVAQDTPNDNGNSIDLRWNASLDDGGGANDVVAYRIYRATRSGGYGTQWLAQVPATGQATYTYTDNAANSGQGNEPQDGVDYYYVVTAVDAADLESIRSNEAGPVRAIDNIPPQPPSNLVVTNPGLGGTLELSWTLSPDDPASGQSGAGDVVEYHIYRGTAPDAFPSTPTVVVPAGTNSYSDTTVADGQDYYYKIRAYDGTNESVDSNIAGPVQSTDDNPPQIVELRPADRAVDVPPSTNISFAAVDTGAGVDDQSLSVTVKMRERGQTTWSDVQGSLTLDRSQLPRRLSVVFDPSSDFVYLATVQVTVQVADRRTPNPNTATKTWRFTIAGPPTNRVAGRIAKSDGQPLAGVRVTVGPFEAVTAADGTYEVTGLADGTYEVRPQLQNWAFLPPVKVVTVPPDAPGTDFTAVPGYDIRGKVTLSDGKPLAGVTVSAGTATAVTDSQGRYALLDLPAATYTVVPVLRGYAFEPASRDVKLEDRDISGIDFTARPVRYSLSGRVVTALGLPVAGVRVTVYDDSNKQVASTQTNEAGRYLFSALAPARYTVRPQRSGYDFEPREIAVDLSADTTGVDFEALPMTTVRLTRGLNFVGVPVAPLDPDPLHVFGDDTRIARWDPEMNNGAGGWVMASAGTLPPILAVAPAKGFWVWVPSDRDVNVAGRPLSPDASLDVVTPRGWNMLANPYGQPMPWSVLGITEGMPLRNIGYIYDKATNSYVAVTNIAGQGIVDTIPTNSAFWIRALDRTVVRFRPIGTTGAAKTTLQLKPGDFVLNVVAETAASRDAAVLVGVISGAELRGENPPAMPGMVDLWIEGEGEPMAADVRGQAMQTMSWRLAVQAPKNADQVALSVPDLSRVPADKQVTLVDLDTGKRVYMRTQARYVFPATENVRHFELRIEDRGGAALVVSSAQAVQRGANAVVTFSVSRAARVSAEVLNMAGRVVARLAQDRVVPAGSNSLAWNLRGDSGAPVPAGRYLVRLVAVAEDGQQQVAVAQLIVRR
ncbi:MAG: carboxypeptidase regulatory-like domain-containing protein, partial [Armatimonadetes bacterium]|nr:carboxypeptidase regulatory-like domain-containing protein [Armatimonadota bacterium]